MIAKSESTSARLCSDRSRVISTKCSLLLLRRIQRVDQRKALVIFAAERTHRIRLGTGVVIAFIDDDALAEMVDHLRAAMKEKAKSAMLFMGLGRVRILRSASRLRMIYGVRKNAIAA